MSDGPRHIGGPGVVRLDAAAKVRGQAGYVVDQPWHDSLYGAVVRAERGHALVRGIDSGEALAMPGVVAVVTGEDLRDVFPYFGHYRADHQILALEKVRYWGEPVAVLLARTKQQAVDAARFVEVEYEDLDELMSVEEALAPGVDLIHPDYPDDERAFGPFCDRGVEGTNEAFTTSVEWGDVRAGMAEAVHVERTGVAYPML